MAVVDRIRGSVDLPLAPEGLKQVYQAGAQLRERGGFDVVYAPDLKRTMQTALALAGDPSKIVVVPALRDMCYGQLEGSPSKDVYPIINKYIKIYPDLPMAGRSAYSGGVGDSFNAYKARFLKAFIRIMKGMRSGERIAVVINRRSVNTIKGWLAAGARPDLKVDADVVTEKKSADPTDILRLSGKSLRPIKPTRVGPLQQGLYIVRHGATAWNEELGEISQSH